MRTKVKADLRELYDAPATAAKVTFCATLRAWMDESGTTQRGLGERIGYSGVSVSEFIREPERIPENFIRVVSLAIPEMAGEYIRFRLAADALFWRAASEEAGSMEIHDRLQKRAAIHAAIAKAREDVARALAELDASVS